MIYITKTLLLFILLFIINCDKNTNTQTIKEISPITDGKWYKFNTNTSWHYQSYGNLKYDYNISIYNISLFNFTKNDIQILHKNNKKVICHFSIGLYSSNDIDKSYISSLLLGNSTNNNKRYFDIRSSSLIPIMQKRILFAKEQGCDGVELTDGDIYTKDNGVHITYQYQLKYNKTLANIAHKNNLSVGFKDNVKQLNDIEAYFDFATVYECLELKNCKDFEIFTKKNKSVLNIEFENIYIVNLDDKGILCSENKELNIYTLILPPELDNLFRYECEY
jgi:hypothetical protein